MVNKGLTLDKGAKKRGPDHNNCTVRTGLNASPLKAAWMPYAMRRCVVLTSRAAPPDLVSQSVTATQANRGWRHQASKGACCAAGSRP
jgi:hypothetical protein